MNLRRLLPPLAVLVVGALYLAAANPDFRFMEGASAIKLLHAQSLLAGRGYTDIGRVGAPPEIVRPPGFPAILALLMTAFGENLLALKIVNNLFAALGVLALFGLFHARTDDARRAALLAAAGFLFPFFYSSARYLEAETIFCAVLYAGMYGVERASRREWRNAPLLIAVAVAIIALVMLRTVGALLAPAAILRLWRSAGPTPRRAGWAVAIGMAGLLSAGGWMLRNQAVAPPGEMTYLDKLMAGEAVSSLYWLAEDQRVPLLRPPRRATARDLAARAPANGAYFLRQILTPFWPGQEPPWWPALPVAALMVIGLGHGLRRRREIIDVFAPLYLAVILLWPYQDSRFLLPIFPFLLLYLLEGIETALAWLGAARPAPAVATAVAAAVLAVFLARDASMLWQDKQDHRSVVLTRPGYRVTAPGPGAARSAALLDWIRTHSRPGDRVMYHSYPPCALLTDRECTPIPMVGPDRLLGFLDQQRVTWLVEDNEAQDGLALMSAFTVRYLSPLIASRPELFRLEYQTPDSNARVWRYLGRD